MKLNLKERKGITLIALVITIIVLLILAGVSVAMLTGQNGILTQANNAKASTANKSAEEKVKLAVMAARSQSEDASLDLEKLTTEVTTNYGGQVKGGAFPVTVTIDGKSFTVDSDGNVELSGSKPQASKVKVGDFVNYSAGNWTDADMTKIQDSGAKIAANKSTSLPSSNFQFGGFTEGSSKDGNATPNDSTYKYVTDKSTGSAVTGWRVFDVDGDSVTLISAGCPEDYYHPYGKAYISEYILSGNTNSSASSDLGLGTDYTARDWSMYVNSSYGSGITATALTKTRLDQWYNKNYNLTSADTYNNSTFQKIYGTNNESLIDNYSYYWLASARSSSSVCNVNPSGRYVNYNSNNAFGVRVLVSLPSGISTSEPVGTKTVTSRGADYTYNVWNIN